MENFAHRVERIVIRKGHENHAPCQRFCNAARKVSNTCTYQMRQAFIAGSPISASTADKILKKDYKEVYTLLPSAGSQRLTQIVGDNWKSWIAALADYKRNPLKYQRRPKMPGYARAAKTFVVGRNGHKTVGGYLHLSGAKKFGMKPIRIICCQDQPFNSPENETIINDVRIVPQGNAFVIEVVYLHETQETNPMPSENAFGIDLGIDNLVTIVSTQQDYRPVLVKGKAIKSINAKYNKLKAQLASKGKGRHIRSKLNKRYWKIHDYFHKVSYWIVQECIKTNTGTIVIGLNADWKRSINIGRVNNQKFVSIPHKKLIEMIEYKAAEHGIQVIVREESYTSKTSSLDLEKIPTYGTSDKPVFVGKRVKRGLFRSAKGILINADVNGAANILRKEIGDQWLIEQLKVGQGVMDTPIAINHIDRLLEASPRTCEVARPRTSETTSLRTCETTSNRKAA